MALIVEDGTFLATAESYISVVDADTYFTNRGNTVWAALSTTQKEQALRKAADFMGQTYRMKWNGYRTTDTQALDWPRYYVSKRDSVSTRGSFNLGGYGGMSGTYYTNTTIPVEVKAAQCELAVRASVANLLDDLQPPVTQESVGTLHVRYDPGARKTVSYPAVDRILAPLIKGYGSMGMARG